MKKYMKYLLLFCAGTILTASCSDFPIDEDDLLITDRTECAMLDFQLLGADHQSVFVPSTLQVDTLQQTVTAVVRYGTNLQKLKPSCSLSTDAKVTPRMGVWTDFSNLENPLEYTVISGNRKIRKTYKIILTVQDKS